MKVRNRQLTQRGDLEESGTAYTCASGSEGRAHARFGGRVSPTSRRPIWRREEFAGKESGIFTGHKCGSLLLFCPIVCCDARGREGRRRHSSYRVDVASGDQIVPSFFCPLPLRHPVSFCGSVTKTIWASERREGERQGERAAGRRALSFLPASPRRYKTQLPQRWRRIHRV